VVVLYTVVGQERSEKSGMLRVARTHLVPGLGIVQFRGETGCCV